MRDEEKTGEHGSVATEAEAFRFLSDVMRGTLTEPGGKAVSVGDRLKACSGLLKLFEIHEEESAAGERELALAAASERIGRSIAPGFAPVLGDVLVHGHTHYDLPGGRGSMKSSFVSLTVVYLLLLERNAHALVLRKVANTMRDSVYAQYLWALEQLGVQQFFDCKLSPMELVFRPTGQKILFRGADDPMKIKSIKVPFGSITVTHFEEKDQFAGRAEIRTVLQSTMRGGSGSGTSRAITRRSAGTTGPISTRPRSARTGSATGARIWKRRGSGWANSSSPRRRASARATSGRISTNIWG